MSLVFSLITSNVSCSASSLVRQAFQQFVRESPLAVCSRLDDGGHWRTLLVRSSGAGQLLASVTLHPQQLAPELVRAERDRLAEFFRSGAGADCKLDALFFQEW